VLAAQDSARVVFLRSTRAWNLDEHAPEPRRSRSFAKISGDAKEVLDEYQEACESMQAFTAILMHRVEGRQFAPIIIRTHVDKEAPEMRDFEESIINMSAHQEIACRAFGPMYTGLIAPC